MFDPKFIAAVGDLIVRIGLPSALLVGYLIKDWYFTGQIVANNTKVLTILELFSREGVKCRRAGSEYIDGHDAVADMV